MQTGYNLGAESVALFLQHEIHTHYEINTKSQELEGHINKMEDLERFLSLIKEWTSESVNLDFQNEEDRQFVDRLRGEDLSHIFPEGKYRWNGPDEIDHLTRSIHQHIEGPLQRNIHWLSEQQVIDQTELNRALEIFRGGQKRWADLMQQILNATARAR